MSGVSGAELPGAPTGLRVEELSCSDVTLAWDPSVGGSGWIMYQAEVSSLPRQLQRFGSTEPRKTFNGLVAGLTYTASVVAVDARRNMSSPVSIRFTTPVDTTAPTTPTRLRLMSVGGTGAMISWHAATDMSPVSYVIRSGADQIYGTRDTSVAVLELLYLSCVVQPGSTHTLTVEAQDRHLNVSGRSNPLTVTFPNLISQQGR